MSTAAQFHIACVNPSRYFMTAVGRAASQILNRRRFEIVSAYKLAIN